MVYAWLTMMYWGFILFMTPRLLGTRNALEGELGLLERLGLQRRHDLRLFNLLVLANSTGRE